jgi:alpha-1,2-glucosyltransferase
LTIQVANAKSLTIEFLTHRIAIILVLLSLKKEEEMGKLALAVIVSSWIIPITIIVNHIVPEPYMVRRSLITSGTEQTVADF